MSPPVRPEFNPADAWIQLVNKGISEAEATRHVMLRIANLPEKVQTEYLKDVDPGAVASFGLGMADMMSFGLGDQAARLIWGKEALDTQQAARQEHKTAHTAGEIAGLVGPAAVEVGLARAGKLAPSALRLAVNAIRNPVGRGAAKVALNAATGAAYAGAQAAGRTEGSLTERAAAAGRAAPTVRPLPGLLGIGDDIGMLPTQTPVRSVTNTPPLMAPRQPLPSGSGLDVPTFMRRAQDLVPDLSGTTIAGLRRLLKNPRISAELRAAIETELARRLQGVR